MIFSPLNRFCIDDNITNLFRMNPKMKTIKKQFRWNFVVVTRDNDLQHGDGEQGGVCQDSRSPTIQSKKQKQNLLSDV